MRDQYAGDLSDVLKFSFLRALVGTDRNLGIAWYYVPGDDGRADGRHLEWRREPAWQVLDAKLHAGLSSLPERSIAAMELADIWPLGTTFFREPVALGQLRDAWGERMREALATSDVLFLDSDNGVGSKTPKHATLEEIRSLRKPGRSVVFISFPGRNMPHDDLLRRLHERLRIDGGSTSVVTLRTSVSLPRGDGSPFLVQRQRWFTVVDATDELIRRVRGFASGLAGIPRVGARIDGGK
jgi:hypothetical protein